MIKLLKTNERKKIMQRTKDVSFTFNKLEKEEKLYPK